MLFLVLFLAVMSLGFSFEHGLNSDGKHPRNALSARIVGGDLVSLGEIPSQASLAYRGVHVCGGTIIASDWILTAAHCVAHLQASDFVVRVGLINLSNPGPTQQSVNVQQIISHDLFDEYREVVSIVDSSLGSFGGYDIAVLKLASKLTYNGNVAAVTLPPRGYVAQGSGVVSGWGALNEDGPISDNLYKVNMPILSLEDCQDIFGDDVTERFLCGYNQEKDACQGDSGGPMTCNSGSIVCGIISAGVGCARDGEPGVYTNVESYLDWLDQNMN